MLVLRRNEGERVIITLPNGQVQTVTVVEIGRYIVRLGFDLPRDCIVDREEVHLRKQQQQEKAQ